METRKNMERTKRAERIEKIKKDLRDWDASVILFLFKDGCKVINLLIKEVRV